MRLNNNFLVYDSNDEHYMISTSNTKFSGIVNSNETASFIINCLKEEITKDEIIEKILNNYKNVTREIVTKDVDYILTELKNIGAIDE